MQFITIDAIIFLVAVFLVTEIKRRKPTVFFLGEGACIFLPPKEQTIEEVSQEDNKKKKVKLSPKTHYPIQYIEAKLDQLRSFPLYEEYDKMCTMTTILSIHLLLCLIFKYMPFLPQFFHRTSSLPTLITILVIMYGQYNLWKVSTHNGLNTYEFKAAVLVSSTIVIILSIGRLLLKQYIPATLEAALQAESQHLNTVLHGFSQRPIELGTFSTLSLIFFTTFVLLLLSIPAIIKYGNAYTQLLLEAYLDENTNESEQKRPSELLAASKLRLQSMKQLKVFNSQLILYTAILLVWGLPMVRQELSEGLLLWTLFCAFVGLTAFSVFNFNKEINMYLSYAYENIKKLQKEQNPTESFVKDIQRRVYSYIYLFWYPSLQMIMRIIMPLLLLLLVLQKEELGSQATSYQQAKYHYGITVPGSLNTTVNLETSCGLIGDPLMVLKQLYRCPANSDLNGGRVVIGGLQLSLQDSSIGGIIGKASTYGLFLKEFESEVFSQILWYYMLGRYVATLGYIIFLRKTVVEI